ncbi:MULTISPECIES: YbjN domain-containing protein [unclassified Leptolyngbya]|uniref:T3SS (YopN, CesT) and YbjN peptide-binding chaperone 1 n=1 Tax=unclassified Leptolyngbya TaxID=2650499 RepID=UPI001682A9FF|nr:MULTISPECIES: YbjN domain-containing protein [unclassified Leptolyngbya]MBD1911913.1 YbjN domain-containing protein [Leptolyngbya sp. FACHB-8]MBD2156122.1 YbjN domain-containing protein [Leptolyngbya sp. FACHB-16]
MALSFASKTQELSYTKVVDYLQTSTLFENAVQFSTTQPRINLTYGSARVAVEVLTWDVHPWEERELAIVRASSCVTVNSHLGPELMDFLLTENQRMRFGAFHLGPQGEVLFAHSVLGGEGMDLLELQTCILSVVTIADTYDDLIVEQFGGQRALDLGM